MKGALGEQWTEARSQGTAGQVRSLNFVMVSQEPLVYPWQGAVHESWQPWHHLMKVGSV